MVREGILMRKSPSTRKQLTTLLGVVLVAAVAGIFYSTAGLSVRENALKNDFLGFYAAGVQVREGDSARLHDHKVQLEYQARYRPEAKDVVPFPRPRFYAEVFRPLAGL